MTAYVLNKYGKKQQQTPNTQPMLTFQPIYSMAFFEKVSLFRKGTGGVCVKQQLIRLNP